jgi:predicted NUDIX family NTP pyrophosphohydrolase
MPKMSAGLLMYRKRGASVEVLLVHPGGPFWVARDDGAWSIPKGEYTDGEDPLAAAIREFTEETGVVTPDGHLIPLSPVRQPSGKIINAWALEGDCDSSRCHSNLFSMEWPPKSGAMKEFPEADRAEWFSLEVARMKLTKGQVGLLD